MADRSTLWLRGLGCRLRDLARALATLPDARGWAEAGALSGVLVLLAAPLAWSSGLVSLGAAGPVTLRTVVVPYLAPGLVEEALFRGLMLPSPSRTGLARSRRLLWWGASLLLYVVAHPLVAALVRPAARGVFDAPGFLLEVALLGATTTVLYQRTGSLWPGVLLHGTLVALWLNLGGAAMLAR